MQRTWLHDIAEKQGTPLVTLDEAKEGIERAKKTKADKALASIMLKFGRMTDEARAYVEAYGR